MVGANALRHWAFSQVAVPVAFAGAYLYSPGFRGTLHYGARRLPHHLMNWMDDVIRYGWTQHASKTAFARGAGAFLASPAGLPTVAVVGTILPPLLSMAVDDPVSKRVLTKQAHYTGGVSVTLSDMFPSFGR